MKKIAILICLLFALLYSCSEEQTNQITNELTNAAASSDTNFVWYQARTNGYTLYSDTGASGYNIMMHKGVQLPFFETFSPAAKKLFRLNPAQVDMWPNDGWTLLQKQFGEPTRAPQMPYFILYNHYRGVLRFFFYNARVTSDFSYALVKLNHGDSASASLGMDDDRACFIDDYNPKKSIVAMCKIAYRAWSYADFILTYDSSIKTKNDVLFWFTIVGVHQSEIQLDGGITLNQVLEDAQLNASGSSFGLNEGINAIKDAKKTYDSVDKLVKDLKQKGDKNPNAWYAGIAQSIGASKQLFPVMAAAGSLISSFLGLGDAQKPVMLNFKGDISLTGTIKENNPTFHCGLAAPGMPQSPTQSPETKPLYNKPLGVFGVKTQPTIIIKNTPSINLAGHRGINGLSSGYTKSTIQLQSAIEIAYNNNANVQLISSTASYAWDIDKINTYLYNVERFGGYITYNPNTTFTFFPMTSGNLYSLQPTQARILPITMITNKIKIAYHPVNAMPEVSLNHIFVQPIDCCPWQTSGEDWLYDKDGYHVRACNHTRFNPMPNTMWSSTTFKLTATQEKDESWIGNVFLPDLMIKVVVAPKNANPADESKHIYFIKRVKPKYIIQTQ